MARKHRRVPASAERDLSRIANDPSQIDILDLAFRPLPRLPINSVVRSPLVEVEDHRVFHPDRVVKAPPRQTRRWVAPTKMTSRGHLQFSSPQHVIVCARRRYRKEVLHALGRVGRGSGGRGLRRRRTDRSNIHC